MTDIIKKSSVTTLLSYLVMEEDPLQDSSRELHAVDRRVVECVDQSDQGVLDPVVLVHLLSQSAVFEATVPAAQADLVAEIVVRSDAHVLGANEKKYVELLSKRL